MFAVIKVGGKQYRVSEGDIIRTEKVEAKEGETVDISTVLMYGKDDNNEMLGTPLVDGITVNAEVLEQIRDKKVIVFKKIRRHNYRRKNGHRQHLSILKIKTIKTA
jgi:large subunit ribosomal protein L21